MCEPTTILAATAIGLQTFSGIAQSQAQKAEGNAQNNYYQYLAAQNEQQAKLAEKTGKVQSRVIQDVASIEGKNLVLSQAKFRSSQRAALAASGISLSSVTADDIATDTSQTQALDEATLRYNADVRSFEAITGANNQAFSLRSEANSFKAAGQNAKALGKLKSRSTLIGTATKVSTFLLKPR